MKGFEGRAAPRDKTRMRAMIDCKGHKTSGAVLDLSRLGACLYLSTDIPLVLGSTITVDTIEMGLLTGTVRWTSRPRVGVQLQSSTNTEAKVESYFKQLRDGR